MASFWPFAGFDPLLCFLSRGEEDSLVRFKLDPTLLPLAIIIYLAQHSLTKELPLRRRGLRGGSMPAKGYSLLLYHTKTPAIFLPALIQIKPFFLRIFVAFIFLQKRLFITPMNIEEFNFKDRLIKGITTDGHFKISVVKTTEVVKTAQENHQLSLLNTVILGRALTATMLLASELKGEERIRMRMDGDGPIGFIVAEANSVGEIRGYVKKPGR